MAGERAVPLATLLQRLPDAQVAGDPDRSVTSIEIDSRAVHPGSLFVALRGSQTDGHRFVPEAIANGARVVVAETASEPAPARAVTFVRVSESRRALSAIAAAFYADPSATLDVVGITGTNGKTTTSHMLAAVLNEAGVPCGTIGTVGAEFRSRSWQLANTTPLPPKLQELLANMRDDGAAAVAMEVSSHALAMGRVDDVRFRITALTNVTRDHLDFHETIDAYAAAKRRLFDLSPTCVLNVGDPYGERWALELCRGGANVISYGDRYGSMYVAQDVAGDSSGTRFTVNGRRYALRLPGRFNVSNALAAIAIAEALGVGEPAIARGLASLERVPGRMEHLSGGGVDVVIDYAHTPDALERALLSLRETATGAVSVVFGCGGDRDRGKRPQMGAVAARFADRVYVTSDNPRSEEPRAIADAIVRGIGSREHIVELDRRRAIERAIAQARTGDVVLVAGKGHEAYQIVGDRVLPFDDAAVAREALAMREAAR